MSKYGVISDPYFPVFELNTGKYGPGITPYLDTFHPVIHNAINHETIIRTGIACMKIAWFQSDSACWWYIVRNAKSFIKHF